MAVDDSYTKSLLHFGGADTSTTFTDESGKTWTAEGDAQLDTAQKMFGTAAGLFDGTGDYISTPDHADWFPSTGNYTIDFRVRFNALPGNGVQSTIWNHSEDATNGTKLFLYNDTGTYTWRWYHLNGGSVDIQIIRTVTPSVDTWYHIEWAKDGTDYYLFEDGTKLGATVTDASTFKDFTGLMYLGAKNEGGLGGYFNGWLDEVRFSKGIARHTANFTPPTVAYNNAGFFSFF